jgi:hypothetical protein
MPLPGGLEVKPDWPSTRPVSDPSGLLHPAMSATDIATKSTTRTKAAT